MIFQERPNKPTFLLETTKLKKWGKVTNEEAWAMQFEAKLKNPQKGNEFQWAKHEGKKVNELLLPLLKEMTQDHCAFCDIFPLEESGVEIEHFYPKSKYPLLSYTWENLFYCCSKCQKQKSNNFDEKLLKPDEKAYHFEEYFIFVTAHHQILLKPNPNVTLAAQERAEITIKLYGLNDFGRPQGRWREYKKFAAMKEASIDDFPYRYLFL